MTSRPKIISFICVTGYLSVVFTFPQIFSPQIKKLGVLVPAIYGLLVAANFIACVGLWYFKQWGVQLYVLSVFAKILFYLLANQLGFGFYFNLVVSGIFIFFLLRNFSKMNPNL